MTTETNRTLLNEYRSRLGKTTREMAELLCVPYSSFRYWIISGKSGRDPPMVVMRLASLLVAINEGATVKQLKELV